MWLSICWIFHGTAVIKIFIIRYFTLCKTKYCLKKLCSLCKFASSFGSYRLMSNTLPDIKPVYIIFLSPITLYTITTVIIPGGVTTAISDTSVKMGCGRLITCRDAGRFFWTLSFKGPDKAIVHASFRDDFCVFCFVFLPKASVGLWILSLPASLCVHVCASPDNEAIVLYIAIKWVITDMDICNLLKT